MTDGAMRRSVNDDGARAGEDQCEGAEEFSESFMARREVGWPSSARDNRYQHDVRGRRGGRLWTKRYLPERQQSSPNSRSNGQNISARR